MIVYYSEYSMFVVGDYVPMWLPKWASQLKTIMSDLRLRNGNFPFQNRKGCELGLYTTTVMEMGLRHLLQPGTPMPVPWSSPVPARRDWTTVVCFSCGLPGHGVSRCPHLDETFPYMLPGWSAEKVDGQYMMILPRAAAERLQ